ncbi:IS4 family transposase [Bradyrhizobium sp. HKCCYLRH3099]|uniref:IS4 family transposase n=1 Tax=unclassified Bradyrhizobium TaxID=2631580 RepID=UPI003EB89C24
MRHQNSVFHQVLKFVPWDVFDGLVEKHGSDLALRKHRTKDHLIAMLYGQLSGARSLREIELGLKSQEGAFYHLGGCTVARSSLAELNASTRSEQVFVGLLAALMRQLESGYRRKIADCVRLIDSTSVRLSSVSQDWAKFSAGVCGAKAHIVYDPDADQPLYLLVTAANVNDITAAKAMPIEPKATYVFDLGYYDFGWWATLHDKGCRFVTRLKANTPFEIEFSRPVDPGSSILSDRIGYLPKRLAASRKNPMSAPVRELQVVIDTGKVLRIVTNDLQASAQEIADLYKRRWAIELFFRWVKQTLRINHFLGCSETAVRIQIVVALIAFLLLRLAQEATKLVASPLAFARLIRMNLMHRRSMLDLISGPGEPDTGQLHLELLRRPEQASKRLRPPMKEAA